MFVFEIQRIECLTSLIIFIYPSISNCADLIKSLFKSLFINSALIIMHNYLMMRLSSSLWNEMNDCLIITDRTSINPLRYK